MSNGETPYFDPTRWRTDIENYWPRRLLHIPTMTSYERSGRDTYKTIKRPKYAILSYTWGRWQTLQEEGRDEHSRALPVLGTTWAIPSVREEHFTVEAFQGVISRMASTRAENEAPIEWAWVDVACIDQENHLIKMDEVGRQASIFRNASRAYVWLSRISTDDLGYAMYVIRRAGGDFSLSISNEKGGNLLAILRLIRNSIVTVLDDPWFSSLWTLQELMMRNDAVILSREAESVQISGYDGSDPVDLDFLMKCCVSIQKEMVREATGDLPGGHADLPSEVHDLLSEVEDRIYYSGLPSALVTSNPNVQYGAAKTRETYRREDRIYGIMQIYGIRVGQSVRPEDQSTLDELVEEFALAINARSALMGQMFVHTAATSAGRSWCITEASGVPDWLLKLDEPLDMCRIGHFAGTLAVVATGRCCAFLQFLDITRAAGSSVAIVEFFLDHATTQLLNATAPGAVEDRTFRRRGVWRDRDAWQRVSAALLAHFDPNNLVVLLLGKCKLRTQLDADWLQYHGLVLQRIERASQDAAYQRLGMVCWRNLVQKSPSSVDGPDRLFEAQMVWRAAESARSLYLEKLEKEFSEAENLILV